MLRGETSWVAQPLPAVNLPLPSAERRRTSASTRVAWAAALQALTAAGLAGAGAAVSSVFVSSGGDGAILHQLCTALATPAREVSPIGFHNSVHNAPAGYYSIAQHSHAPSTSLGAHPAPFAAGLLEACVQAITENGPVLLVGYELAAPFPLAPHWPAQADFAVALVLTPTPDLASLAGLSVALSATEAPLKNLNAPPWQQQWAEDNPMAVSLPLLSAQARATPLRLHLPYLDRLSMDVMWTPLH